MTRSYAFLIGLLAAIWGASYLFIKVAVRDFPPRGDDRAPARCSRRSCSAGFLVATRGAAPRSPTLRAAGWARLRDRRRQRRDPVHADRVGREAHRLGGRRGGELDGADLQRPARAVAAADREDVAAPARRRPDRPRRRRRARRRAADRDGWWFVAGTMAVVVASLSLRVSAASSRSRASRARRGPTLAAASMLGGALVAAAARARLRSRARARLEVGRLARGADAGGHGARAAHPLPRDPLCTAPRARASSRI